MSNSPPADLSPDLGDSFVARQIRRCNRNLLTVNGFLLASIVLFAFAERNYLYNFIEGPWPLDRSELLAVRDSRALSRYFVTFKPEQLFTTGVKDVELETDTTGGTAREKITADYYVAPIANKLLIVKRTPGQVGELIRGALESVPPGVLNAVSSAYQHGRRGSRDAFLPVMLDASDFRTPGYVALLFCLPLVGLATWNINKGLRRYIHPEIHPVAVILAKKGPLNEVVREIEKELAGPIDHVGSTIVANSWLFRPDLYVLHACPFRDLVWAYKKVTHHSTGFQASGILLWDRHKRQIPIPCEARNADHLLELIHLRAPWAAVGYSKELAAAARRNWAELVTTVDQKRRPAGLAHTRV